MKYQNYIDSSEVSSYGVEEAAPWQVAAACRTIDAEVGRPEGLLWSPDASGMAAWMTNKSPTFCFKIASGVPIGSSVVVTAPGGRFGFQTVGDVVILDRTAANAEACVVAAASGDTITLDNVQFSHAANTTLDFGLTLVEEVQLRPGKPVVRLSKAPVANILCGFSRVGFGKLPFQITDRTGLESLLLSQVLPLNGPPTWSEMDISQWDVNQSTGDVAVYPFLVQHAPIDVRLRYVTGWSVDTVPGFVKQAVANIVRTVLETDDMPSVFKVMKAGDATLERFSPSVIDDNTRALLQPLRSVRMW